VYFVCFSFEVMVYFVCVLLPMTPVGFLLGFLVLVCILTCWADMLQLLLMGYFCPATPKIAM
jgi:hypothetical protein